MAANVFPTIDATRTIVTQYPYDETDEWIIAHSEAQSGQSYTWPYTETRGRRFSVSYTTITRAELTILEDFFNLMRGPLGEFEFTDDNGVTWERTKFLSDQIEVNYPQAGQFSTKFLLQAEPQDE